MKAERVRENQRQMLFHLMQKYLYEMSAYYDDPMDEEGNFDYPYLPYYFQDNDRFAYFLYEDKTIIGFALINQVPYVDEKMDFSLAEFTIFPYYRHQGKAIEAIEILRKKHPGIWQIKYHCDNQKAVAFYKKVKDIYHGYEVALSTLERVLILPKGNES